MTRDQIAERLLGCALEPGGYAPCPGKAHHTKGSGRRDFKVSLDGAPTAFCFHSSCSAEVEEFNKQLRREIWILENGRGFENEGKSRWGVDLPPEPQLARNAKTEIDMAKVQEFIRGVPAVDEDWLRRRSPEMPGSVTAGDYLNAIYARGERVLVFTRQTSQGDFLWQSGRGGFRLARERGVKAVPSALPAAGPEGVWYLVQPVTGLWEINGKRADEGDAKYTRRSECNVTAWRYFVLESDELSAELWLRVLVSLPMPITAIYTSGGRSVHALVRYEVPSKAHWDATREVIRQIVCPLGADPKALTAVRLSRLPCCKRGQKIQRLLYLDPQPDHETIRLMPEVRA